MSCGTASPRHHQPAIPEVPDHTCCLTQSQFCGAGQVSGCSGTGQISGYSGTGKSVDIVVQAKSVDIVVQVNQWI